MNITARAAALVIGYVFGLFQTAYLYGKYKGIDIRNYGSGNAGTTNTLRVLGTKAGIIVFIGDVLKCVAAEIVMYLLLGSQHSDILYLLKLYTAAGCVLGHDFPFYMNFKGGKGIAVTAGLVVSFHWMFLPVGLLCFLVPFLVTHYVSLGSLLVYVGFVIEMIVCGQAGLFGASGPVLTEMYIISLLLAALAFYQHRGNIVKLAKGTERKTSLIHNKAILDPDKKETK